MLKWVVLLAVASSLSLVPLHSPIRAAIQQVPAAQEDPAHNELRALKKELTDAVNANNLEALLALHGWAVRADPDPLVNANNLEALLALLAENVVVTWQNAEVSRGPEQVRAYYDRMMKGDQRIVDSISINPTVDELTHLYGDTGVAFGSSKDHFKLRDGRDFEFDTRWTATAVKKNGKWKVASFHASTNSFDNPVLWIAVKRVGMWTGVIAVVLGLVLGFGVSWLLRKRRAKAS